MDIFFINLLNTDKKINLHQYHHKYSKFLTKKILNSFFNISDEIKIKNGKPYLKTGIINFSISHSKNIIAIAFDKNKIGIDIEQLKDRDFNGISNYLGLKLKHITKIEFYQIWTTYEANFKSTIKNNVKSFLYKDYVCSVSFETNNNLQVYEIEIPINKIADIEFINLKQVNDNNKNENAVVTKEHKIASSDFLPDSNVNIE